MKLPAGITTISGHSAQSRNTVPGFSASSATATGGEPASAGTAINFIMTMVKRLVVIDAFPPPAVSAAHHRHAHLR